MDPLVHRAGPLGVRFILVVLGATIRIGATRWLRGGTGHGRQLDPRPIRIDRSCWRDGLDL